MKALFLCLTLACPAMINAQDTGYARKRLLDIATHRPSHSADAPLMTAALRLAEDPNFSDETDGISPITYTLTRLTIQHPSSPANKRMLSALAFDLGRRLPAAQIIDAYAESIHFRRDCWG